jgi:hypothetical protein
MRTKFVAAALVAGMLFVASCKWFSAAPKANEFNIVGKWKLDSLQPGKDTSPGFIAMAVAMPDSSTVFDFKADSNYVGYPDTTTNKGKYYVKDNKLYIFDGTSNAPYSLTVINDSLVHLTDKDSLLIVLKRQ